MRRFFTSANVAAVHRLPLPTALAALLVAALLAGCGAAAPHRVEPSDGVLAPELHVVRAVVDCDPGKNAYCGSDLVVGGPSFVISSDALRAMQTRAVKAADWKGVSGQARTQLAATSPNGKVYLSYATGADELASVRAGLLKRPPAILHALRAAVHRHRPVLSISLSPGP